MSDLPATPGPSGLTRKDYAEFLFKCFVENNNQARHQDSVRSAVTGTIVTLSTATLGLFGFLVRDAFGKPCNLQAAYAALGLGVLVIILGVFGAIFVARQNMRYQKWRQAAVAFVEECNAIYRQDDLGDAAAIFKKGAAKAKLEAVTETPVILRSFAKSHTASLWIGLMSLISMLGAAAVTLVVLAMRPIC